MTQRERERLSGFCGQSLPDSQLLLSLHARSQQLQFSTLVSAGSKDKSCKTRQEPKMEFSLLETWDGGRHS